MSRPSVRPSSCTPRAVIGLAASGLCAVALLSGCGMNTIPRVAVAGTTIVLPLPKEFGSFGMILNSEMSSGALQTTLPSYPYDPLDPSEDLQRGELVFELWTEDLSQFVTYIGASFISRMQADESTRWASPSIVLGEQLEIDPFRPPIQRGWPPGRFDPDGQNVALLDLPADIPRGAYKIKVKRMRRSTTPPYNFEEHNVTINGADWTGWGDFDPSNPANPGATDGIPIYIVDSETLPGSSTDENHLSARGWFRNSIYPPDSPTAGFDSYTDFPGVLRFVGNALHSFPRPKAAIVIGDWKAPSGPAALDFEVEFPADQVEILGVSARSANRSAVTVAWDADPFVSCGQSPDGRLRIHMIDPREKTGALEVVFRLVNWETPCGGRLEPSHLVVDASTVTAYDLQGLPLTGYATPTVVSTTF